LPLLEKSEEVVDELLNHQRTSRTAIDTMATTMKLLQHKGNGDPTQASILSIADVPKPDVGSNQVE
jgi:hypothetical protein